ncbi:Ankyrin repeat protein [Rickettsiales bacterium Ac37b]|nr:Ankyrin repeat protein [Rickettsiales bacterium Ac37b]
MLNTTKSFSLIANQFVVNFLLQIGHAKTQEDINQINNILANEPNSIMATNNKSCNVLHAIALNPNNIADSLLETIEQYITLDSMHLYYDQCFGGYTPLMISLSQKQENNFFPLLNSQYRMLKKYIPNQIQHNLKYTINIQDNLGKSLLHLAVEIQHSEYTTTLLQQGADPNMLDNSGQSPLHLAVLQNFNYPKILAKGVDNPIVIYNCKKSMPHLAITPSFNHPKALLQQGANPNMLDNSGQSPLHLAIAKHNYEYTEVLLEYAANPNI